MTSLVVTPQVWLDLIKLSASLCMTTKTFIPSPISRLIIVIGTAWFHIGPRGIIVAPVFIFHGGINGFSGTLADQTTCHCPYSATNHSSYRPADYAADNCTHCSDSSSTNASPHRVSTGLPREWVTVGIRLMSIISLIQLAIFI